MNVINIIMSHIYGQDAFLRLQNGVCYRLIGAVIHYRYGENSGHYTSYFADHNQNEWFLADDASVSILSFSQSLILHNVMLHFRSELSV